MNNTVAGRLEKLKKKSFIIAGLFVLSIILMPVISNLTLKDGKFIFLEAVPLLLFVGSAFSGLLLFLRNQGLSKSVNYLKRKGKEDLLSQIELTNPVYSSTLLQSGIFNLYENNRGFFLDNPGLALEFSDIRSLCAVRYNGNKNIVTIAVRMSTPLESYENNTVHITDRCIISMETLDGSVFGTGAISAQDAEFIANYLLLKNPNIVWLGEKKVRI